MKTNITLKILLSLIIIVGAIGMYFAATRVPAKVELLEKEKEDMQAMLDSSTKKINETKLKATSLSNRVTQTDLKLRQLSTQLSLSRQTQTNTKKALDEVLKQNARNRQKKSATPYSFISTRNRNLSKPKFTKYPRALQKELFTTFNSCEHGCPCK